MRGERGVEEWRGEENQQVGSCESADCRLQREREREGGWVCSSRGSGLFELTIDQTDRWEGTANEVVEDDGERGWWGKE